MARTATPPRTATGGHEAAFSAWFSKHADELRAYCTRRTGDASVAEEVVQETFARAWTHVDTLSEREEVGPWLYRVARNLCVDSHRSRSRLVSTDLLPERSAEEVTDRPEAVDPVRHVMREEERALVREALATLNARHQDVLYLRDIEGLAYEELGRRHGLSGASTRAVLARARRRLRDELKTMGQGVFGAAVLARSKLDDLFRRASGDGAVAEPLAAAVAHYVAAAAAVVGLALGGSAPAAVASVGDRAERQATSPAQVLSSLIGSVTPASGTTANGLEPATGDDGPADGGRQNVVVLEGPGEALPPNPSSPNGQWVWLDVYWQESEHEVIGMRESKAAYDEVKEQYDGGCDSTAACPREDDEVVRL